MQIKNPIPKNGSKKRSAAEHAPKWSLGSLLETLKDAITDGLKNCRGCADTSISKDKAAILLLEKSCKKELHVHSSGRSCEIIWLQ